MVNIKDATETTVIKLLTESLDWQKLILSLEATARVRGYFKGMEEHHVEPDRKEEVYLWPLEHLSIHICHAKLNPTDSTHAKVGAFVKPFPGSYRRIIVLSDSVKKLVLSFGQTRPSKTVEEMTRISNLPQSKIAQQESGRRNGRITGPKTIQFAQAARRGVPCTWGDKISAAIEAKGTHVCPHCGKEMKNIASNILQHQRGPKCLKPKTN